MTDPQSGTKNPPVESKAEPPSAPQPPIDPTAEEQMAQYEQALKESDWGHQPC